MMSKLRDSVWWYPIEVTEGIKDDESNFACPSFLSANLQTGMETQGVGQNVIYIYCAIYILSISGIYQVHEWETAE